MLSNTRPPKVGNWTEPALRVLRERYLTRKDDQVVETPEEMCWRVAQCLAQAEERWGKSPGAVQEIATAFYELMVDGFFLPNSPTLMNAGKGNQLQYSACYVLPVGDSMEEIFDAVKAAAIIHKCLVGDTLVMTDNGLTRLSDVPSGAVVMTDEGPFEASALHDNGDQPVFEVRTHRGLKVVGTAEHRLLVVDEDGTYSWRRIGELQEGDWLVVKPGFWTGGKTALPEFSFTQKHGRNETSFKAVEHRLPLELTPELGELAGLYVGDGSNHRDGIRFTVGTDSPEITEKIKELSFHLFGKRPSVSAYRDERAVEVSILSTQIRQWFDFLGITKVSSREARVPQIILQGPEEVASAFLRGLFSADGCIRENGHITLTTVSERLGEELQVMMLALGIPIRLRLDVSETGYRSYQLSVCTKAGFRTFREKIGFLARKKQERLVAVDDVQIFVKGETIPNQRGRLRGWYDALPRAERSGAKVLFDDLLNRVKEPRELSRQRLTAVMEKTSVFPPFFEELAAEDFFFVRVTAIGYVGVRRVYDLTVPMKHAYLANGFVAHNSGGGTGFAFSRLRPKDDVVASTGGKASGPVSFLRVFNGATEAVKQGGCVAPDTRVATNRGVVKIAALGPASASPDTWHAHPDRLLVATDQGLKESDEFYNHGVAPVRRVRTRHGYSLCATLEHRIRVIDEAGNYAWKAMEDIKVGDWAALQKQAYPPVEGFRFPDFQLQPHPNATPIRIPEEPTEELGEFVGFLIGDGAISVNKRGTGRLILTVGQAEPDVARHLLGVATRIFGLRPVRAVRQGDASESYFFHSTTLVAWLKMVGVEKESSLDARLPEIAFRAGAAFARGVLRGLFTADGTVTQEGYPSLASTSRALVEDVQQLLLSLGVPTSISVTDNRRGAFGQHPLYRLRVITRAGLRVFAEEIGFFSSAKASRLQRGLTKAWEFNDIIPFQGALLQTIYGGPSRGSGPGRGARGANRKLYRALQHYLPRVAAPRHLTRSRLRSLAETHPEIANHPALAWFLTNNQFYDQVAKIEEGESLTLDLSVPANNTYVANGFVSHNTRRGANMGILKVDHPDILEFIECKLDGGITNFNISVAATDRFMEALERGEDYGLINPHTGAEVGKLSAREVFERIVRAAWRTGDPGMVFLDRINKSRANPTPEVGMVEATNPCVTGDTLVATPEGSRRVDTISPGDLILTVKGPRPVERVEAYRDTPTFHVRFSDGGVLRVTAGHQFYVSREGGAFRPIRLDRCSPGDEVQTLHDELFGRAKILGIEPAEVETTYDLYEPETDTWITEGYVSRGCGEQPLLPNEACNLGSLNVSKFAKRAPNGEWTIDWEELERVVRLSVRFLDDVIEMNPYPLPEIDATVKANRRIGLGVMGWADLLFVMGIPYDSQEALDLADQFMAFIEEKGHDQSAKLAEERGPFPNWSHSIYKHNRPLRNSTITTIAPTGTISMIAGCSSGIEPIFALAFEHRVKQPDGERVLTFVNETFERIAREQGFYSEALMQEVVQRGSLHGIPGVLEPAQRVFKTSHEIPHEWHVRQQAAFQKHTDNGVSKCVTGDTLIFTDRGILRIQDLYRGESTDAFSPVQLKVADWGGAVEADLFYFGGKRDVIALETDLGVSLRATPNHRVRVMAKGEIVWRRMDEIKTGDWLVVPYGFGAYGHLHDFKAIYGAYYRPAERTNAKRLEWPHKITTDLARLLGYLIADSGFSENQVMFTQKDDGVVEDYRRIMQQRFGVEPRVSFDLRRENLKQAAVNSRDLIAFFAEYLGTGDRAETKHTPRCVLASGPEVMKEYVRGLTLDGYVSAQGRLVVLGSVSRRLAEEVQAILLNLGIVARLETKGISYEYRHEENRKEVCYEVVVLSKFRRAFLERIGFAEERKQALALEQLRRLRHPDTHYVIPGVRPLAVSLARAKMAAASSEKLRDYLHSFITAEAEVTEETVLWLLDITQELKETNDWQALVRVVNQRVLYTPVTSVWGDKEEVFDLQVPSTHSFITNGLVSHNTINLPNGATEADIADAYLLAWQLGCLGITVFRDGCKGEQVLNVGLKGKKEAAIPAGAASGGPAVIKPRPHSLTGTTYRMQSPIGTAFITVNETPDGEPFEVFVQVGKGGSDTMAVAEALGRLISLVLRLPSPFSSRRRLEEVISQLSRIGGGQPTGFGPSKILSLPDALSRTLAEHLGQVAGEVSGEVARAPQRIGDLCKECGQATFIYEEGCKKCLSCGYNEC